MKKAIAILIALAALGLLGWRIYLKVRPGEEAEARRGGRALAVEVQPVARRTLRDVAEFTGTLLPRSQFVIAPKVSGRLERLEVNFGDEVRSGDPIAVLDSAEYAQEVAQARAALQVSRAGLVDARSALGVAQREFDRASELRDQQVASEAELDQARARLDAAQAEFDVAEAQIEQRDAALKAAEVRLSYTSIQAAWVDGQDQPGDAPRLVAERFVDEGAMLRANEPIVSIVDLSRVLAVIQVIERDFPNVRVGQAATITVDAHPDRQFTGHIVRVAPVLREESRQARVEIEIPNPERLLAPGMFARARIQFAQHDGATAVPVAALVRRDGQQGVFRADLEAGTAHFVPVRTGILEDGWIEILEPALDGVVVTLGQHLLEEGAAILVPQDEPAGGPPAATAPGLAAAGGHP